MRGRTNTMTTVPPKTTASTAKRISGQARLNSDDSRASSTVSILVGGNSQESMHQEPLRIITEVDGNIIHKNISISYMLKIFLSRDEY